MDEADIVSQALEFAAEMGRQRLEDKFAATSVPESPWDTLGGKLSPDAIWRFSPDRAHQRNHV